MEKRRRSGPNLRGARPAPQPRSRSLRRRYRGLRTATRTIAAARRSTINV